MAEDKALETEIVDEAEQHLPARTEAPPPAVMEDGRFIMGDPDKLKLQLQRHDEARKVFLDWIESNLVPGSDYLLMHQKVGSGRDKKPCPHKQDRTSKACGECRAKATLLKPGAEKICGLLELEVRFAKDHDTWEMLGQKAGLICLLATLHPVGSGPDAPAIAEGRGIRNISQDGYGDDGDPNKSIKMAQKSGHIDAVIRIGGLSSIFTLDLDQMKKDKERAAGASGITPPPDKATDSSDTGGDTSALLSADDWAKLKACMELNKLTPAELKLHLDEIGVEATKPTDIPTRLFDDLMSWASKAGR